MGAISNPFAMQAAADRYRSYRPDYSEHLAAILKSQISSADLALDVAAGTGVSTHATESIAARTVAIDASPHMVAVARRHPATLWTIGSAERLPFANGVFDLVTVGSALHWFDRARFVAEARRVTAPGADLVVHDHGFTGQMADEPAFSEWIHHRYLHGYPAPARGEKLAPGTDLGPFRFVSTHRYEQGVEVTRDTLAGYLTTQSNLQVVMTSPRASADVLAWLEKELAPFFEDAPIRTVTFAGLAVVFHKQ